MELFSLLAKLTLDKSEFDKGISAAEKEAKGISVSEPELGLDTTTFDTKIAEVSSTTVDSPDDPTLGLDKTEFDTKVEEAEGEDIEDPADPEVGLDTTPFDTEVETVEDTPIDDPGSPSVGLDHSDFDQAVKDVEEQGSLFSGSMTSIFQGISSALLATGIVAAVGGIVSSLKEGIELAKNHGDEIDKQSQKMGISAKAYQEWSYALNLSGASITDLNRGLRTWQQSVGDQEATDKLKESFKALGIDADEAFKKIEKGENLDSLLNQTMSALADYGGSDRGAIAEALFGKGATGLNALFNQTSAQIEDAKKEAEDLGMVMTDEEVANAAAYMDATTRFENALNGLKESLVSDILPILTEAANKMAGIIAMFNWRTGKNTIADRFGEIDEKATGAITQMEQSQTTAETLVEKLAAMGDYWTLDDKGKKTWNALAAELKELFPQLDSVIEKDRNVIMNNTQAIKDNIAEWTKLEEKRILDENLAEKKKEIAAQYAAALDKEIEAELKEAEAAGKGATAIEQINAALEENSVLSSVLRSKFGTDTVTEENASEMLSWLKENGYDTTELGAEAIDEWYELTSEAESLREEANKMTAEADEATESYNKYAEALARKLGITTSETEELTESIRVLKEELKTMPTSSIYVPSTVQGYTHAIGSDYIPFDNYPAILHRGEKVLTATEARQSSNDIDYTELENRIISAIQSGMENATVNSYIDGQAVTDTVNRYNINAVKAKRFTT